MDFLRLKYHKLTHWEYWPQWAIYYPIFPIWFYFALRARSFFFFNAANPSIKNGGMAMESKMEIYDIIPSEHIPKTILIEKSNAAPNITEELTKAAIKFPLIAKPDIGMKAYGVSRIKNISELELYSEKISGDFLIQELIEFPNEVGIFYVRHPSDAKGRITGIVTKQFLSVIGDGEHSIVQLIKQNPRSHFQLSSLKKKYGNQVLSRVLEKEEKFILVPYGSHTRGAKFIDDSDKINKILSETIDNICTQIPGFYYGRLDILHTTFKELSEGKNFSIIEINGAGSEPTHMYDPKHSLFFAWREITRHWKLMFQISLANKNNGHPYLTFKEGRTMLRQNSLIEEHLKLI